MFEREIARFGIHIVHHQVIRRLVGHNHELARGVDIEIPRRCNGLRLLIDHFQSPLPNILNALIELWPRLETYTNLPLGCKWIAELVLAGPE